MSTIRKLLFIGVLFVINDQRAFAQQPSMQIDGMVVNAKDQTPLVGASVYLDHTTIGTITSDNGSFSIDDLPAGNYNMVVSYVGYEPLSFPVSNHSPHANLRFELRPNTRLLKEVVITGDSHWAEYLSMFKMFFLGSDDNAKQCTIENPDVLSFHYNDSTYMLRAEADKPLIIDNKALGYKIYYQLTAFVHYTSRTYYSGYTRFEEMKPAETQEQKKWKVNREDAYYGSVTHFMRSLVAKQLRANHFVVKKLAKVRENLPHHTVLQRWEGDEFRSSDTIVTMRWNGRDYSPSDTTLTRFNIFNPDDPIPADQYEWGKMMGFNILYPDKVPYDSMLTRTDSTGDDDLSFNNSLFITYTRKKTYEDYWGYGGITSLMKMIHRPSFEASIITMKVPGISLDAHGNLADPNAIVYEGYWARQRVADQLPFDYSPLK